MLTIIALVVALATALVIDLVEVGVGLWYSKRRTSAVGPDTLVGEVGVAVSEIRPVGQVKVNGEIWSATSTRGCDAGSAIVVRAVEGLTLKGEELV